MEITGIIKSGAGKGAFFTQVDWVVEQCEKMLGYKPFPGTLNIHVNEEDQKALETLFEKTDFELIPTDPNFCAAQGRMVTVNGVPGAVVLPSEDVRIHGFNVLEVIASCNLKESLGVEDGDTVTVFWASSSEDLIREVYDFASSAGALEGYLFQNEKIKSEDLNNWVHNLTAQYGKFPENTRKQIQPSLDRTLGRAVHSLVAFFGEDHAHVSALKGMIAGATPNSYKDFQEEKKEKARKYANPA